MPKYYKFCLITNFVVLSYNLANNLKKEKITTRFPRKPRQD